MTEQEYWLYEFARRIKDDAADNRMDKCSILAFSEAVRVYMSRLFVNNISDERQDEIDAMLNRLMGDDDAPQNDY